MIYLMKHAKEERGISLISKYNEWNEIFEDSLSNTRYQDPVLMPLTGIAAERFSEQLRTMKKTDLMAIQEEGEALYRQVLEKGIAKK